MRASGISSSRKPLGRELIGSCAIVFPPPWLPVGPYPSLPVLGGALRRRGIRVTLHDLNCICFDDLLTGRRLRELLGVGRDDGVRLLTRNSLSATEEALWRQEATETVLEIDAAVAAVRDPRRFYDQHQLQIAVARIGRVFVLLSDRWPDERITLRPFDFAFTGVSSAREALAVPTPLDECYERQIAALVRTSPSVVGFSVHSMAQLVFALRGASIIRALLPRCHITVGGTYLSRYHRHADNFVSVLLGFDTAVLFDGVDALETMCRRPDDFSAHAAMPNVVALRDGAPCWTRITPSAQSPSPPDLEYGGLPLDLYLAPDLIVSMPATVGCHWRRCSFCSYNLQPYHEHDAHAIASRGNRSGDHAASSMT